jgi:hypothetical protein
MWSEFTVNDVRFGDSIAGASFGGLVIHRYQAGSTVTISGGGAGIAKCVGGTGTDLATCTGNWIDLESQGLTIATTSILLPRNDTKENSVAWEANRTAGAGTGVSIKADNIYTSDGYVDTANTYGIQTVTSIDIANTRVLKKFTGTDSNGVIGNEGDELIVDSAETAGYKYVTAPTDIEKSSRGAGLIISNNVQIKELNIESIQLIHPSAVVSSNTLLHGMKLQNFNMSSTLSVTPIR